MRGRARSLYPLVLSTTGALSVETTTFYIQRQVFFYICKSFFVQKRQMNSREGGWGHPTPPYRDLWLGMSQLCQKNCPLFYSIILLIIAIILKESTHHSTTHSNYAAELQGIFFFHDKSDGMGLLKRSSREHGPEESREVCSLEKLLFLSLLVPPSVDTERNRRDVSGTLD